MNYRLGIFGFVSMPALNDTDSLNVGLLNQRLAPVWIQKHISAFGGDPENVTIFGESDGGEGVGLQITAYGGLVKKHPFKRANMQSGSPKADAGIANGLSSTHTAQLIETVNCTSSTSAEELAVYANYPSQRFCHPQLHTN